MKILITGGAGYVGCSLVERLVRDDRVDQVIIYDSMMRRQYGMFADPQINGRKLSFLQADILDNHSLAKALIGVDVVYHLAAKVVAPDSDSDSQQFEQINNWGTANVVYEVAKSSVRRFIYLSTAYVYGRGDEVRKVTGTPSPHSFYGISKWRGEEHVRTLPDHIDTYIIRSGTCYGYNPCTRFDLFINKFLFEAHYFRRIVIHGDGSQVRPFIHIDKATQSLSALTHSELPSGVYNLLEYNASVMEIVAKLIEVYPDLEYQYVNRHITMSHVMVEPSEEIAQYIPYLPKSFAEELGQFRDTLW